MADDLVAGVIGAVVMVALHYSGAHAVGWPRASCAATWCRRVTPDAAPKKRVRPFPLAELPRVARAQVEAARLLMVRLPLAPGAEWAGACRAVGGDDRR